ncbi:MAG: hypothetical protein ACP5P2_00395 [Candidatus Micrarchaeia archaeon]|jgi:hypothetical protein
MDKKQFLKLASSIFVFVVFIASYMSFNNAPANQGSIAKTTTIPQTFPALGSVNATIVGYGNVAYVGIKCNYSFVGERVSALLPQLEKNGSINNYYAPTSNFTMIYLGKMTPRNLSEYLSNQLGNSSSCISMSADTQLLLPSIVKLNVNGQLYPIRIPDAKRSLSFDLPLGNESYVKVKILALLTANGTVYNMTASVV